MVGNLLIVTLSGCAFLIYIRNSFLLFTTDPYTEHSIKWYTEEVLHGVLLLRVDCLLEAARSRELLGGRPQN